MSRTQKAVSRGHLVAVACLLSIGVSHASAATVYSQDSNLADFTSTISTYGTFIQDLSGTISYTPTNAILLAADYPRKVGTTFRSVDVQFGTATDHIVVFDNIDHLGYAWDVFQYEILGSNDGSSFTSLFNPHSVNEADQPNVNAAFTLNQFTGTAPTLLNNSLTPGLGSSVGNIGYEEYFQFSTSYSYYRFTPSYLTLNVNGGENELELSAVGIAVPSQTILDTSSGTPEPASFLFAATGLAALAARRRRA